MGDKPGNPFYKVRHDPTYSEVTNYSKGAKPKQAPKSEGIIHRAFSEVFSNTPKIVQHTAEKFGEARAQKQRVAIALSKARSGGARGIGKK